MTFTKGQNIKTGKKHLTCIVADDEFAVFAPIVIKHDADGHEYLRTRFGKLAVYDNAGTVDFDYETIAS